MDGYVYKGTLGRGVFGKVSLVQRVEDCEHFACKEIDYRQKSKQAKRRIVTEVNILRELSCPYIVKYFDRVIDRQACKIHIIMEHCPLGSLEDLIKRHKTGRTYIKEPSIWKYLSQLY